MGRKKTNFLLILHWLSFWRSEHFEFEVIGAIFNFSDSFNDLVITTDSNKEKKRDMVVNKLTYKYAILTI